MGITSKGSIRGLLGARSSSPTVEHCRLIEKLRWYGIDKHRFVDWLRNRTQKIMGCGEPARVVTHGVIQGSLLGPKLFLIFTNDLPSYVAHGRLIIYADDCQFLDSESPKQLSVLNQRVENTLETAMQWFTQNRLKLNPSKTELVVIKSRQRKNNSYFCIRIGANALRPTPFAKILGVYVDSALSWEKQVTQVCRRCYTMLFSLSKLRNKLPAETKQFLVQSLVFPHITYCLPVCGGCA